MMMRQSERRGEAQWLPPSSGLELRGAEEAEDPEAVVHAHEDDVVDAGAVPAQRAVARARAALVAPAVHVDDHAVPTRRRVGGERAVDVQVEAVLGVDRPTPLA